ncbi:MAG: hypothetical protein R8K49_07400 [Mariprofundaceae bacterium]
MSHIVWVEAEMIGTVEAVYVPHDRYKKIAGHRVGPGKSVGGKDI